MRSEPSRLVVAAAYVALAMLASQALLLASLHILSPEFDPAWRVISEYANGEYGWLLSLMFLAGAAGTWAFTAAIWSQVGSRWGRVGRALLLASGAGQAMAAVFDIDHPLHNLAGLAGTLSIAVGAMLVTRSLIEAERWRPLRSRLLWTANLVWIALVLFVATTVLLVVSYTQSGAPSLPEGGSWPVGMALPSGTIAINGWFNRIALLAGSLWMVVTAWPTVRLRRQDAP